MEGVVVDGRVKRAVVGAGGVGGVGGVGGNGKIDLGNKGGDVLRRERRSVVAGVLYGGIVEGRGGVVE